MLWSAEKKVGLTVLIGLGCMIGLLSFVSRVHLGSKGYSIKVMFNFVDSLKPDGQVLLGGGVQIGRVEGLRAKGQQVEVTCRIQDGQQIAKDAEITIHTNGILGEKYVQVYPGDPAKGLLADGDVVEGTDPGSLDRTLQGFEKLADSLDLVLNDSKVKGGISGTLKTANALVGELLAVVRENRDDLRTSISNLRGLSENLQKTGKKASEVVQGLDEMVSPENKKNLNDTLAHLQASMDKLDKAMGQVDQKKGLLGELIYDQELADDARGLLKDLKNHPWKLLWKK